MRRQHSKQTPPSPSWISPRNHRSASLLRIRLARRESVEDATPSTDTVGSGVRPRAKTFRSGVSGSPSSFTQHYQPANEAHYQHPASRRTPVLTMALLKLEEQLSVYCSYLAEPSMENVAAACDLLSRTIATASPQTSSEKGSPASFLGSPQPSSPRAGMSPSRSPLRLFGNSGSPLQQSSASALALEEEWERFTMPLFLLAGAEGLYASLGHAQDPFVAAQLRGLFHRTINDITLVRETLCDPFLIDQRPQEQFAPILGLYYERASTVATTLHAIVSMAQIRCRMIQFQSTMWESMKPMFGEWIGLLETMRQSVPTEDESAFAEPIVRTFRKEVEAWKYLLETAHSLEQCRFSETMLSCQKAKLRLSGMSTTRMQQWQLRTIERLVAMFQIYFDRVHSFAKPLYGFQSAAFDDTADSLDVIVLHFLQAQQKLGTSALAVAVVLDAGRTSNIRMERGFTVVDSTFDESQLSDLEKTRLQWPAVYMRSTIHHGESNTGGGLLGSKRRTTNRKHDDDPKKNTASFTEHYIRWSTDGSSSANTNELTREKKVLLNFQEYAPGSGSSSWPHSEWKHLVRLVNEKATPPPSVSGSESLDISDDGFFKFLANGGLSTFLDTEASSSQGGAGSKGTSGQTSFYVTALSDFSSLVVMTKAEEESRWHRRRGSKLEDDVGEFLDRLSAFLRVDVLFRASTDPEILRSPAKKQKHHGVDFVQEIRNGGSWNDENVQELVQALKVAFGLKSNIKAFAAAPLDPSYNMGFRMRKSPKSRPFHRASAKLDVSALAFFLGTELMHSVSNNE